MPAFTQAMADAYYGTLTPEQQAEVDASGGPSIAWFTNAYNAGVPGAVQAGGGEEITDESGYGGTRSPVGEDTSSEWLGNRKPTPAELRAWAPGRQDEDYNRFDDRQLAAWINSDWDVGRGGFFSSGGQRIGKPTEYGGGQAPGGGGYAGSGYGGGGGGGTYGGAPAFEHGDFVAPTYEEAVSDPGYQFALRQGVAGMERSASARGTLRTGGTLRDIVDYGQRAGAQQYQNVYNRRANTFGINYQIARDEFAPRYGSWQTQGGWNQQRYLQREQNIYGLLNQPPPSYPGY